jgi:hypothetical protein
MSIAVMNWVWANSPASGNDRLVLLALADACSRADGTGCWPSAATIARKANISDRSVRRVIARLEAGGHVKVHRGGGRAGSTNSYTVVMVINSPGQNVTPDSLSGADSGDTPPLTQLCPGTPDTAVSADPPASHPGTAAPHAREARAGDRPTVDGEAQAGAFFDQLAAMSPRWLLTTSQRSRLTPAVAGALARGWAPADLAQHVGANTAGIRNPGAVLAARLSKAELPPPPAPRRPPWCGECDQATRMLDFDGDAPRPCPRCKAPHSGAAMRPASQRWSQAHPAVSTVPATSGPAAHPPNADLG